MTKKAFEDALRAEFERRGIWFRFLASIRFSAFVSSLKANRKTVSFVLKCGDGRRVAVDVDGNSDSTAGQLALMTALEREGYHAVRFWERARTLPVEALVEGLAKKYNLRLRVDVDREVRETIDSLRAIQPETQEVGRSQPS